MFLAESVHRMLIFKGIALLVTEFISSLAPTPNSFCILSSRESSGDMKCLHVLFFSCDVHVALIAILISATFYP